MFLRRDKLFRDDNRKGPSFNWVNNLTNECNKKRKPKVQT